MTRYVVTDEQLGHLARKQNELFRRVRDGSLHVDFVLSEIQEVIEALPDLRNHIEVRFTPTFPSPAILVHCLFTSVQEQVREVRRWNEVYDWGFTAKDFRRIEKNIPDWPKDRLAALVLVPYYGGVWETFHGLWEIARAKQECYKQGNGYAGPNSIRLLGGADHPEKHLRWEVIDLGADSFRAPAEVRDPKSSPHAGVFAAAALHPEWVRAMDGVIVPYVWSPGYEFEVIDLEGDPEPEVPNLEYIRDDRSIVLRHRLASWRDPDWAVPRLLAVA